MTDNVKQELISVMSLFKDDEGLRLKDIALSLERPTKTIERYLKILKDQSLIEFRGRLVMGSIIGYKAAELFT